jgi:hypothetical protein
MGRNCIGARFVRWATTQGSRLVARMVRLAGAALLALAAAGLGSSEGASVTKTGGSGTSAYSATFEQVPGSTPAAVQVNLTINAQACNGACGWMSIGFGPTSGMSNMQLHTCFQSSTGATQQLCATGFFQPPPCATQSVLVANSLDFNSGGNFVCSFTSSAIGGVAWANSQNMVMAYGTGATFIQMSKHAAGARFSLGTVNFSSPPSSGPPNSAAQTGAGVMSALLMVFATLL